MARAEAEYWRQRRVLAVIETIAAIMPSPLIREYQNAHDRLDLATTIVAAIDALRPVDQSLTLTVEEAGRVLGIGRSAAYAAVRRGDIPAIRVGRTWRVPRHRLDNLLNGDTQS